MLMADMMVDCGHSDETIGELLSVGDDRKDMNGRVVVG